MSRAKKHHQTPQAYLRQFGDLNSRVQVYDRITGQTRTQHIKEVAVVSNLYTVEDPDGNPSDAFEQGPLARIDGRVAAVLPKLLEPMPRLTTRDRVDIDGFLAIQAVRTPAFRDFLANSHDLILRGEVEINVAGASLEKVERFIEERYPNATERGKAEIRRIAADPSQPARLPTIDWLNAIVDNQPAVLDLVNARPWTFIRPEEGAFLTCDNPFVLIGPPPLGIGNASIVHWPFSPNRALWRVMPGSRDRLEYRIGTAPEDLVAELNQKTADQASRQIIWHPETNPIDNVTLPSGPQLTAINGIPVAPGESSYDKIRQDLIDIRDIAQARRNQKHRMTVESEAAQGPKRG